MTDIVVDVPIYASKENPVIVEVDAMVMAQIIAHFTHAGAKPCIEAANALCDYLAQVHASANQGVAH